MPRTSIRWVQRYSPELEHRLRQHLKPTNKSWRVDETYSHTLSKSEDELSQLAALTNGYPLPMMEYAIRTPSHAIQKRICWR